MFIIHNDCIGRHWMHPLKRMWADCLCWIVGHDRDYPHGSVVGVNDTAYASCLCLRCWRGGYDDDKIISTGGTRLS
jgi:hypothetical protein